MKFILILLFTLSVLYVQGKVFLKKKNIPNVCFFIEKKILKEFTYIKYI